MAKNDRQILQITEYLNKLTFKQTKKHPLLNIDKILKYIK